MYVICTYHKGFKGQHGIRYLVYVVHRVKVAPHPIHHHYRERFGIETSYRIKNYCRIFTTNKHPNVRLLFVALAFILVNLWVYLLWCFISHSRRGGRFVYRQLFGLKTMLEFLSHPHSARNRSPKIITTRESGFQHFSKILMRINPISMFLLTIA